MTPLQLIESRNASLLLDKNSGGEIVKERWYALYGWWSQTEISVISKTEGRNYTTVKSSNIVKSLHFVLAMLMEKLCYYSKQLVGQEISSGRIKRVIHLPLSKIPFEL
jgi:hypothetical protein